MEETADNIKIVFHLIKMYNDFFFLFVFVSVTMIKNDSAGLHMISK